MRLGVGPSEKDGTGKGEVFASPLCPPGSSYANAVVIDLTARVEDDYAMEEESDDDEGVKCIGCTYCSSDYEELHVRSIKKRRPPSHSVSEVDAAFDPVVCTPSSTPGQGRRKRALARGCHPPPPTLTRQQILKKAFEWLGNGHGLWIASVCTEWRSLYLDPAHSGIVTYIRTVFDHCWYSKSLLDWAIACGLNLACPKVALVVGMWGNIASIDAAVQLGLVYRDVMMNGIARSGRVSLLQWAVEGGYFSGAENLVIQGAIQGDRPEILHWLQQYNLGDWSWDGKQMMVRTAMWHGDKPKVLQFLADQDASA